MTTVIVSSPGKVIIHGEHAVVFGKRALAGSLGLRTELSLRKTNSNCVAAHLPDIDLHLNWKCESLASLLVPPLCEVQSPTEISPECLARLKEFANINGSNLDTKQIATIAFLYLFCSIGPVNGIVPSVEISICSALPTSAGLGSSAAFSTCLATSLLINCGHIAYSCGSADGLITLSDTDLDLINKWSFMAEKIIHGRPSGIDNAVSTYGGALCFQGGKIEPLTAIATFRILLVNTRVTRSTKLLVEGVRLKHDKYPEIIPMILNSIEGITERCETTLAQLCSAETVEPLYRILEELIDMNQYLLNLLGVGHKSLDLVCSIATRFGLHAKLTGAGGGGCVFVLLPPYVSDEIVGNAKQEIIASGFDCFETSIGGPGVTARVM